MELSVPFYYFLAARVPPGSQRSKSFRLRIYFDPPFSYSMACSHWFTSITALTKTTHYEFHADSTWLHPLSTDVSLAWCPSCAVKFLDHRLTLMLHFCFKSRVHSFSAYSWLSHFMRGMSSGLALFSLSFWQPCWSTSWIVTSWCGATQGYSLAQPISLQLLARSRDSSLILWPPSSLDSQRVKGSNFSIAIHNRTKHEWIMNKLLQIN